MIAYRLAKKQYADDLSGKGAELTGGRWNSRGTPMVYTSESRALAMAEVAVHLPLGLLPKNFQLIEIQIPDDLPMKELKTSELPKNWNAIPPIHQTQEKGDSFIRENQHTLLKVPSAVVPGDYNYLINPHHPETKKIKLLKTEEFTFDSRLIKH